MLIYIYVTFQCNIQNFIKVKQKMLAEQENDWQNLLGELKYFKEKDSATVQVMLINTNQTQKTISSCFLYLANATYRTLKNGKSSSARCTLSFVTYSNPYLFNLDYFTGLLIYLLLSNLKFLFINPKTARILFPKDISILITALLRFSQWFLITLE